MKEKFNFEKHKDVISGLFFLLFAALCFAISNGIQTSPLLPYGGSRLIPRLACVVMFICSCCLLYSGIQKSRDKAFCPKAKARNIFKVFVVLASLVVYILLLTMVGFVISTVAFLFFLISVLANSEQRNYLKIGIIAVVFGVGIYFLFTDGFGLILPSGRLI